MRYVVAIWLNIFFLCPLIAVGSYFAKNTPVDPWLLFGLLVPIAWWGGAITFLLLGMLPKKSK